MHDSGTGGVSWHSMSSLSLVTWLTGLQASSMGNFPLFPQVGCPGDELNRCKWNKKDRGIKRINGTVLARPGYFAVTMANQINAEMTVTNHTALYRFTFPDKANRPADVPNSPVILADVTDLPGSRIAGDIEVDPHTGRITGRGEWRPSFGIGSYKSYFCADFKGASIRDTGVWINNRAGTHPKKLGLPDDGNRVPGGAFVQFNAPEHDNQILARVGVSFISCEQACRNAEHELKDFGFERVRSAAEDAWREKLSTIKVDNTGVSVGIQRSFWSGIYRAVLSPQDYTGKHGNSFFTAQ